MQKSEIGINLAFFVKILSPKQNNTCRISFTFKILPENLEKQSFAEK